MNPNRSPEKAAMSAEIQSHVEQFLASGGEIVEIPRGVIANPLWNLQVDFSAKPARETKTKLEKPKKLTKVELAEKRYGKPFAAIAMELGKEGLSRKEAAERIGISSNHFSSLLLGTIAEPLFQAYEIYTINGIKDTMTGHCRRKKIPKATVQSRMERGETLEQALNYAPSPRLDRLMAQIGEMTA